MFCKNLFGYTFFDGTFTFINSFNTKSRFSRDFFLSFRFENSRVSSGKGLHYYFLLFIWSDLIWDCTCLFIDFYLISVIFLYFGIKVCWHLCKGNFTSDDELLRGGIGNSPQESINWVMMAGMFVRWCLPSECIGISCKGNVALGNFSFNLSRNFIATQVARKIITQSNKPCYRHSMQNFCYCHFCCEK